MPHNLISVSKGSYCFCTCLGAVLLFTYSVDFLSLHILKEFCDGLISLRD